MSLHEKFALAAVVSFAFVGMGVSACLLMMFRPRALGRGLRMLAHKMRGVDWV